MTSTNAKRRRRNTTRPCWWAARRWRAVCTCRWRNTWTPRCRWAPSPTSVWPWPGSRPPSCLCGLSGSPTATESAFRPVEATTTSCSAAPKSSSTSTVDLLPNICGQWLSPILSPVSDLCVRELNALNRLGLTTVQDMDVMATSTGRLMARCYIAYDTMALFSKVNLRVFFGD